MNEPPPSDQDDFQEQLKVLRSILQENLHKLKDDPFLGTQLDFWLETARFWEKDITVWGEAGNSYKYNEAVQKMRKVLDVLQTLIEQLNNDSGDGNSEPPQIGKQ